jgi:hypothetical protein
MPLADGQGGQVEAAVVARQVAFAPCVSPLASHAGEPHGA